MLGYLAKSIIIVTYRNNLSTLWVQVMEVCVQYCLCCSDVFSVRKQCLRCCFLNMSSFSLQRASNLENSTYDLYTIPKDADSQNPDGGCSLSPPLSSSSPHQYHHFFSSFSYPIHRPWLHHSCLLAGAADSCTRGNCGVKYSCSASILLPQLDIYIL